MSTAVRRGIYGKLAGDTTLTAMLPAAPAGFTKNIYNAMAPSAAQFPYVIFNKQAGTPLYGMKLPQVDDEVWLVKAVDRSDTADTADDIASRINALLTDSTLSISGKTHNYLRRESDVEYSEVADGVVYRHSGAYYRLMYQ